MPPEATLGGAAALVAVLGSLAATVRTFYRIGERIGRVELKVETLWDLNIKMMQIDARHRGILTERSPLSLDPRIVAQFRQTGLVQELRSYYAKHQLATLQDSELTYIVARIFGDDLIAKICLPLEATLHLTLGDALIAAVYLCRMSVSDEGAP